MSTFVSYIRIALVLVGIWGAVLAPPWVTLFVMVLLALRFRSWEVLVLGMWMDFLWLPSESFIYPLPLFTLGAIILVWGLEPLRNEILV